MSLGAGLVALCTSALPALTFVVSGANAAAQCQWPTVASFRAGEGKCSATLVHPQIVATAAHCLIEGRPDKMRFGEQFSPAALRVDVAECWSSETYAEDESPSNDFAVCRLERPVEGIPPTPLLTPCEVGLLRPEQPAVIVGFGVTETSQTFGVKRYGFTTVASDLRSDGTIWIGDIEVGGCQGDSGGPAFVRLDDGGWRAIGLLTFSPVCGDGEGLFRTLGDQLAWIEETTGFDVTPCHDDGGAWTGGCQLAAEPRDPHTDWAGSCEAERIDATQACAVVAEPDPMPGDTDSSPAPETDTAGGTLPTSGSEPEAREEGAGSTCALGRPDHNPGLLVLAIAWVARILRRRPRRRA